MKRKVNMSGVGMAMGAAFGIAIGSATGSIGVWLPIGIAIGFLYPTLFGSGTATCGGSEDKKQGRP